MWDKAEIRINFHPRYVTESKDSLSGGESCGWVNPEEYDFRLAAKSVELNRRTGQYEVTGIHTPWDSIQTSISGMAIGFFPEGQGKYKWPHILIKASPSKILQGHNVYGTENIKEGLKEMLCLLQTSMPVLYKHLDIETAEIRIVDCTYSAQLESEDYLYKVLDYLSRQSSGKTNIDDKYDGTVYLHKGSDYVTLKAYIKLKELLHDAKQAKRKGQREKSSLLMNPDLIDFAQNRLRLEATIKSKKLKSLGIPTQLKDFIKYHDNFEIEHSQTLCSFLWETAFKKIFDDMSGDSMKRCDDSAIKAAIYAKHTKIKDNGLVCRRKANAIYQTYLNIRSIGYSTLCREKSSTFFRNVSALNDLGYSKGFLRSLDPLRPDENVVSITQLIKIDFSNQRPVGYVEPQCSFATDKPQLRLVS